MKGIKKAAEFRASDALFDPPQARNPEERRIRAKSGLTGGGLGALLGATAGYQYGKSDRGKIDGPTGFWTGGTVGSIGGLMAGDIAGNYRVLKKRDENDEPLKSPRKPEVKRPERHFRKLMKTP